MRITLIGDLQYGSAENENLTYKMKQLADLAPDFAVIMGDIGGPHMRSIAGYEETMNFADMLGCPWHVILGNHDVEYAPGEADRFDSWGSYRSIYGEEPNCSFVTNGVLVICLSVEPQPEEMMRTVHAVYVSQEQFAWVRKQLDAHPGMPTVFITHAPVAGNGFRCCRPMHTASHDTFLDQTYNPERWISLLKAYPQIKVWCSAHFHMGHDYENAITETDGVVHISCGVITCCSRDGSRQTRIVDITEDKKLIAYTFDHNSNAPIREDAVIDLTGNEKPRGNVCKIQKGEMFLDEDAPKRVWHSERFGKYYILTESGNLWEYQPELNDFTGAIVMEEQVEDLRETPDKLILSYDGDYYSVDPYSRARFDCFGGFAEQELTEEENIIGEPILEVEFENVSRKDGIYVQFEV